MFAKNQFFHADKKDADDDRIAADAERGQRIQGNGQARNGRCSQIGVGDERKTQRGKAHTDAETQTTTKPQSCGHDIS